jgi:hypothetical protein
MDEAEQQLIDNANAAVESYENEIAEKHRKTFMFIMKYKFNVDLDPSKIVVGHGPNSLSYRVGPLEFSYWSFYDKINYDAEINVLHDKYIPEFEHSGPKTVSNLVELGYYLANVDKNIAKWTKENNIWEEKEKLLRQKTGYFSIKRIKQFFR